MSEGFVVSALASLEGVAFEGSGFPAVLAQPIDALNVPAA